MTKLKAQSFIEQVRMKHTAQKSRGFLLLYVFVGLVHFSCFPHLYGTIYIDFKLYLMYNNFRQCRILKQIHHKLTCAYDNEKTLNRKQAPYI